MKMEAGSAVAVAVPLTGDDEMVATAVDPAAVTDRDGGLGLGLRFRVGQVYCSAEVQDHWHESHKALAA